FSLKARASSSLSETSRSTLISFWPALAGQTVIHTSPSPKKCICAPCSAPSFIPSPPSSCPKNRLAAANTSSRRICVCVSCLNPLTPPHHKLTFHLSLSLPHPALTPFFPHQPDIRNP